MQTLVVLGARDGDHPRDPEDRQDRFEDAGAAILALFAESPEIRIGRYDGSGVASRLEMQQHQIADDLAARMRARNFIDATFVRAFRRQFGLTPGEVRHLANRMASPDAGLWPWQLLKNN